MSSINQSIKKVRSKKKRKSRMWSCPQLKGICLKVLIRTPKKPNSAQRKVCRVRLSNGKTIIAYIPGIGHNIQEHSTVFVQGGRRKDLPGVKHKVIRGKGDVVSVHNRVTSRSKYGVKRSEMK